VPRPLADDIRAAILADIRAGKLSRNAIARKHGVGAATVTRLAQEAAGPTPFDRSKTVQATRAREADTAEARAALAARRTAFAVRLQGVAEAEADRLHAPTLYWDWGGKDHTYAQKVQPEPTAGDRRAILGSIAVALDKSLKLVPPTEDGAAESRSAISDLLAGLTANYVARHGSLPADADEPR
jgi:transposase-like protein